MTESIANRTAGSQHVLPNLKAPAFDIQKVTRTWRDRNALSEITLRIAPGERIALGGPSGSGKSTLMGMLCGAIRPTTGRVVVDGVDMASMSADALRGHRARCAQIGQITTLVPQLNVHQNVLAGCLAEWPWYLTLASALIPREKDRVHRLLDELEIGDKQWDFITQLSSGQQQRVAIARGLVAGAPVILADEPTSALDPTTAKRVTKLIFDRAKALGATLVFCTHWLQLGLDHADRLIGLRNGELLIDSTPQAISEGALRGLYSGSNERV